jgi:hypothetical protein
MAIPAAIPIVVAISVGSQRQLALNRTAATKLALMTTSQIQSSRAALVRGVEL